MSEEKTICILDYLIGTLATAYKGVITSLILKDFCVLEKDRSTIFKGTILSIPEGNYQASLIHEGIELSRRGIQKGYFELYADSELTGKARHLQIDIIQNGRHIGTFLLKKEKSDEFFISALELSEEIKGINFGLLTRRLQDKTGLLKKAEEIISDVLSAKQDWKKFSEKINSFSKDLFWFDREAYYAWYEVLVKWSVNACERIDSTVWDKAVSNVLSLMELPLEEEADRQKLSLLTGIWLDKIMDSSINLSAGLKHSRDVFSRIHEVFPDLDIRPALKVLITSLSRRVNNTPTLNDDLLQGIKDIVTADDYTLLSNYGDRRRNELLSAFSGVGVSMDKQEYERIFEVVDSVDSWLLKDRDMMTIFYETIEGNMTKDSAEALSGAFMKLFPVFGTLPPDSYRRATGNTVRLMKKLVALARPDICETLLARMERQDTPLKTDIVLNAETAAAILGAGDNKLLDHYKGILEQILIPSPKVAGFYETWAEIVNPLHLERLTKFMHIIKLGSEPFKQILIRMICNIYVSGVFIPDDRIFQREISSYLNSGTARENILLHYLLLKKLPVYFHEVGATGRLRDDTTEIDSWGNDTILYFLRKQVHANASNHLIHVIEEIMKSWVYSKTDLLKNIVPEDILKTFNAGLLEGYSSALRPLFESLGILGTDGLHFERIPEIPESDIRHRLEHVSAPEEVCTKIMLMCRIYCELVKKYALATTDVEKEGIVQKIIGGIGRLKDLKGIITSPEKTLPEESLYFKRHIAFGIPSVMGSYHEPKFDALCESLRIEEQVRTYLDAIITNIKNRGKDFILNDFREWISCTGALNDLLQLHDLGNFQAEEVEEILKENNLYISQIIDLLRLCQKELTWMVEFVNRTFYKSLIEILKKFHQDELPEYLSGLNPGEGSFINKAADIVMRAIMNSITGFFELDGLHNNLIEVLSLRVRSRSDEMLNLSDKPAAVEEFFVLDGLSDTDAMRLAPLIGNKAKNLVYLNNKGLLIPQGVVLPAYITRSYEEYTGNSHFQSVLRLAVKEIEKRTGTIFGDDKNPLFLSVRSGSYVSMPGILSSILYCGMNQKTVRAFIGNTDNPWLVWDSYRRFIEHYGTVVYDLDLEVFETIVDNFLKKQGVSMREDLNAEQMKEVVHLHQAELERMKITIPDDVYEQLKESVKAVYRSWFSERSVQFRKAMGISGHWGTAVTLMQMIYGNDTGSGASVFFTRKPFSLEIGIYGDTKEQACGGELVYGRSVNRPLTRRQALKGQKSLEEVDPQLFRMHEDLAQRIEQAMRGLPQEVEATYTKTPDSRRVIYVLQTRRMEFHRGFTKRFDDICHMETKVIGRGVGVFGGALSGVATFSSSPETARELRGKVNLPIILLRREASTDDVSLMPGINGIITAAGGATSHAAVLAQKFHLTAIVGFSDMKIEPDGKGEFYARIGSLIIREGDTISIDGSTGLVYSGECFSTTQG